MHPIIQQAIANSISANGTLVTMIPPPKGVEFFAPLFRRRRWEDLQDLKQDTIEHILPQTPTVSWLKAFPEEDRRKRWVHDIGNLTLTFDNSSLQNKSFSEKKGDPKKPRCYAGSSFFVERQLVGYSQWTEEELIERRGQLKAWATSRWHVEAPALSESVEPSSAHEKVMRLAEDGGVEQEYQTLLDFAVRHNLYLHPYTSCMVFGPQRNKSVALLTVWPRDGYLEIGVWFSNIEKYQGVLIDRSGAIFETDELNVKAAVTSANIDDFLTRLGMVFGGE